MNKLNIKLNIVFIDSKTRDILKVNDIALITDLYTEDRDKEFIRYYDTKNYYTDMILQIIPKIQVDIYSINKIISEYDSVFIDFFNYNTGESIETIYNMDIPSVQYDEQLVNKHCIYIPNVRECEDTELNELIPIIKMII